MKYDLNNIDKFTIKTKDLKVLYVEDNEILRDATLCFFECFFNDITVAVNGIEGIEKFERGKFDMIISDIDMPRLDGVEMIKKIRELDQKVNIMVLSAYNRKEFEIDQIDTYMVKPIDIDKFIKHLEGLIS